MTCQSCDNEEIHAKGFCRRCYIKNLRLVNPESYIKQKEATRRWQKNNPHKVKETKEKWYRQNPERAKELNRKSKKKYIENHIEYKIKCLKSLAKLRETEVRNILKKHSEDLKSDPERLSTEFLQSMIGIKCKIKADKRG